MYDYRGIDGTGTASSPATGSNQVSYTVRKLADGNCWMSENLKLTLSTSHSYEVATNSGGTTTWTPNSGSGNTYNVAINANTRADINGGNWYYPWYAATAGQGTQNYSSEATRSICPKGWRIPASDGDASFMNLLTTVYASQSTYNDIRTAPLSFVLSGVVNNGSLEYIDIVYLWSATPLSSNVVKVERLYRSRNFLDTDPIEKYTGNAIRCIAIP